VTTPTTEHVTTAASNGHRRLAIFTADMSGGGAERAMMKLAGGIAHRGYDVDLVLGSAHGHHLDELSDRVRVVDLGAERVVTCLPALVRYLRRDRPAVMLTSLNHVNIVGLWARRLAGVETRVVVNEQNTLSREAPNSPRRRHRLVPRLARRFYPWADDIVAVSEGAADDLVRAIGIGEQRVTVVPNPIVTPELRSMAAEPVDDPWFADDGGPVALAVGRFTQQKDFPTLLRAVAAARARLPVRLLILGDGPERARLEALVSELGLQDAVRLPGWVVNPYPYMARADAFVLSSRWEGLPSVLIEALFCGAPVVATDCPSGPMEILEGGRHGLLVPVGDVGALADGIVRAATGGVPRPSNESWQRYEQEAVVDRYLHVLVGAA
jgi:glycosyltransferase involved in cell wall biosynthesis